MRQPKGMARALVILLFIALSTPTLAQKHHKHRAKGEAANLPAVIWHDPGDVSLLNLIYGAGGQENAPNPNSIYTFVKEDMEGTSAKFDVKDSQGIRAGPPQHHSRGRGATGGNFGDTAFMGRWLLCG